MLVKHCLEVLRELAAKFGLNLSMIFVLPERNKVVLLTQVKKAWLTVLKASKWGVAARYHLGDVELRRLHTMHHMCMHRIPYLAIGVDSDITKQSIQVVVRSCDRCQSIED